MSRIQNFFRVLKKNRACKTFIIADAGVHHHCSVDVAKQLIEAAAYAGADAIKFQTYKADSLVTSWAPKYWQENSDEKKETQYEYFRKRDKFDFNDYQVLNEYAGKKQINFVSTPFDQISVQWLNEINVPFWKVASGDIDNYPLLEEIVKTKKPIILSTGASYFSEISETVNFLRSKGVEDLALLHCNLAYPTPNREANLLRIQKLKQLYPEILVGYSDHTIPYDGVAIPVTAVALGAEIIEKHFTLDRTIPGDDHYHSVDPVLMRQMISRINLVEKAISQNEEITESEIPARKSARRSLVANQVIFKGNIITNDMVIAKRPGGGISPSRIGDVLGGIATRNINKDEQILWDFIGKKKYEN